LARLFIFSKLAQVLETCAITGGARVITCVKIVAENIFLLTIFDKSDKEDISDKELKELLKVAGLL
jgi:hypothetical protein